MKITGWHIDGFGLFADSHLEGLPAGLTVIHGPNEAGKSTLLAFIRGVLFGYPSGNTRELKYPPLNGGAHGGRLFLETCDGAWTIERMAQRRGPAIVTRPDDSLGTNADLERLLGHATKPLFKSVFAFSLSELQEFSSLNDEDVREKVFAAGITGVGTSAREAIATLETRATELLKPRSSSVLRDLAEEIEELDAKLLAGRRDLEAHAQLVIDEAQQTDEIDRLRKGIGQLVEQERRLTLLQELWPAWDSKKRFTEELAQLPDTSGFPGDGDRRLATATQTIDGAERDLEACIDKKARLTTEHQALPCDDRLASVAARLEAVAGDVTLHREGLQRSSAKAVEVDDAQQRLDETLRELGPDWDEARLRAMDASIPRREEVREWQGRLDGATAAQADAARKVEAAKGRAAEASDEVSRCTQQLEGLGNPLSSAALDEVDGLVAQLRMELTALTRLEERLAYARARSEDAEAHAESDLPAGAVFDLAATSHKVKWTAALAVLLALALGGIGEVIAAVIIVILAIAAAAAARQLDAARRRQEATPSQGSSRKSPQDRVAHAEKAANEAGTALDQGRAAALTVAKRAGFTNVPTAAQLELRATELAAERRKRDQFDSCEERLHQAQQEHDEAARHSSALATAEEAADGTVRALVTKWVAWRTAAGVDGDLAPESCLDVFDAVRRAREVMTTRDRLQHDLQDLEDQLGAWDARARDVLHAAGRQSHFERRGLPDEILVVHRAAGDDAKNRLRASKLDEQIAELGDQVKILQADRDQGQADVDAVLREARAGNADEFSLRQAAHARRRELVRLIEAADETVRQKIGSGEAAQTALDTVSSGDLEAWASTREQAAIERQQLEQEREAAIGARKEAEIRRLDLEKSADVPTWEAERAEKLTELQRAAHEWRVTQVARQLIADTLAAFVRERQPGVLKVAGTHFEAVTEGRYTRLALPSDGTTDLHVIDQRGARRALNQLSRGTAEQLYLCMRMGLAAEVAERATGLPIVMDDVLVNFSPDRASAMVDVLAEAAEQGQQILFFTCHPSTRDLILDRVVGARGEELERLALD